MSKFNEILFNEFSRARLGSLNSVDQYKRVIREWSNFIGDRFLEAHHGDIFQFISQQKERTGQPSRYDSTHTQILNSTIKRKLEILKSYYRYLVLSKHISENPFDLPTFERVKRDDPKRPAELAPDDAVRKLLSVIPNNTKIGVRDRAMISVMFGLGLRKSEVANLRINSMQKDIFGSQYLRVLSAKRGARIISMSDWVVKNLTALIVQRTKELSDSIQPNSLLFVGYFGNPKKPNEKVIPAKTLYSIFMRNIREAGLPETITPHSARATFVTKARSMNIDAKQIQKDTGHASIQSIEGYDKRYLNLSDGAAKQIEY